MEHASWKHSLSKLTLCKSFIDNFHPHQNVVNLDLVKKMYLYLSSQNTDRHMSNSMSSVLVFCFHISMPLEYKRCANLRGSEYAHEEANIY